MKNNSELTIVIPVKNEEAAIGRLLTSLILQDYERISETPIFIADAGSTDHTREVAMHYAPQLSISFIAGGLPGVGRNNGARRAKSRYVLFIDADIELRDPTLIRRAVAMAKQKNLYCVGAMIRCPAGNFLDRFLYGLNNLSERLSLLTKPYASGMFLLVDRQWFNSVGGFDERVNYAEDVFLTSKVPRKRFGLAGYTIATNRRFKKNGHWKILWLAIKTGLNRNNESFFLKDRSWYFEEEKEMEDVTT